jgi:hypothetical protein
MFQAPPICIEWLTNDLRPGSRDRHGNAEDRVCAELRFVLRTIEVDQTSIDFGLAGRIY